jgi:hypothetical protein
VKSPSPIFSLRGLAVAASAFSGVVHLLLAVSRALGWRTEAMGLAAVGLLQLVVAVWFMLVANRRSAAALAAVAFGPLVIWLYTRTVGYPIGPWEGLNLEVQGLEVLVAIAEIVAGLIAVVGLTSRHELVGRTGLRFEIIAPLLVVLSGIPGLIGIEAVDTYLVDRSGQIHLHPG